MLALRADIATILVIGTYQIGTSFAEWLNDWLTLGVGATFALHNGFGEPAFYVARSFRCGPPCCSCRASWPTSRAAA